MGLNDEIRKTFRRGAASVSIDSSLRAAIVAMVEMRTTGMAIKSGDQVVGVVTDMDLLRAIDAGDDLERTTVATLMTACELITDRPVKVPCVQLHETQPVRNAIGVMVTGGIHNLLVSGEDGYVGVVSAWELLGLAIS